MLNTVLLLTSLFAAAWGTDLVKDQEPSDLYVFAYTLEAQFCYGETDYPGCETPEDYWLNHFTIHGLWPQYSTGGYPSDCTDEPFNSTVLDVIGMDTFNTYWPNVKSAPTDSDYDSFWEHEWTKHGTCSGLSQYDYFNDSFNLIKQLGTPDYVSNNAGGDAINSNGVRLTFGGAAKASLQCSSSIYINGVYTCWSRNEDGSPNAQVECPSDVISEDSCSEQTLMVEGF